MASVHYKNKKTGRFATYAQPMRSLEKSPDWERVKKREDRKDDTKAAGGTKAS